MLLILLAVLTPLLAGAWFTLWSLPKGNNATLLIPIIFYPVCVALAVIVGSVHIVVPA